MDETGKSKGVAKGHSKGLPKGPGGHHPPVKQYASGNPQTGNGPDDPDYCWLSNEEAAEMSRGIYDQMKFPAYKYEEYPKWVKDKAGRSVIVQNAAEEISLVTAEAQAAVVDPLVAERDALALANADLQAKLDALLAAKPMEAPAKPEVPVTSKKA